METSVGEVMVTFPPHSEGSAESNCQVGVLEVPPVKVKAMSLKVHEPEGNSVQVVTV